MKLRRLRDRHDQAVAARRLPDPRLLVAISAAALLAGCSSVPDEVNPVEWYRGASAWVTGEDTAAEGTEATAVAAPASEDAPFPNLASVPERPEPTPEPAAVEAMIASLETDRAEAQAADAELRSTSIARAETATSDVSLPTPNPTADGPSAARRFPPLELPDLRSALGDTDAERTGRFTDIDREPETPAQPPAQRSSAPAPEPTSAQPVAPTPPAPAPAMRSASPARDLASVRDVAPRPPVQPPEPFSTGRRSFASAASAGGATAPSASARVSPRPPIQPPQPYSAPRSSVSDSAPAQSVPMTSLAELTR